MKDKLDEQKVNVRQKLVALWASFTALYIYVDYLAFYMPGKLEGILAGKIHVYDISPAFLVIALLSIGIPALMISLSILLPAKVSRWVNIIVAGFNIPYALFNLTGETWVHMVIAAAIEVAILCLIIRFAWKWPKAGSQS
jgi:hypothetical protein